MGYRNQYMETNSNNDFDNFDLSFKMQQNNYNELEL